jgi:hypothetical protein
MIISSGITIGSGISIIPDIAYTAGLFKTTYTGYLKQPMLQAECFITHQQMDFNLW